MSHDEEDRPFTMKLWCEYLDNGGKNEVNTDTLRVTATHKVTGDDGEEHLEDEPYELSVRSPGFPIFAYALINCQHMYFRINAAERGYLLKSGHVEMTLLVGPGWRFKELKVDCFGVLRDASLKPSEEDIAYIVGRCEECPVSRNLKPIPKVETNVTITSE